MATHPLILVPVVLLVSTIADTRERSRVIAALADPIEREALALESSVQAVNHKLAALTELVGGKEDKP